MKYKRIDGIEKDISQLVYGANPKTCGEDTETAIEALDIAYHAGFRTLDTAHAYGMCESNIGKWMVRRGNRDDIAILDKGCNPTERGSLDVLSAATVKEQFAHSLDALQTDHVELYALHRDDESKPVDEIIEVLNELKSDGKIQRFGTSNWKLYRILQANQYAEEHGLEPFSVISPAYNLADYVYDPWMGSVSICGNRNKDLKIWAQEHQIPVFNYSSLARGFLSGKYRTDRSVPIEKCLAWGTIQEYSSNANLERLAKAEKLSAEKDATVSQIALAWLLAQPLNIFPLVSLSSEEHILEISKAFDISLSREECRWLREVG